MPVTEELYLLPFFGMYKLTQKISLMAYLKYVYSVSRVLYLLIYTAMWYLTELLKKYDYY
jgi:hypothetical protein